MSYILNPLTFQLHGTRLIEASAGTGKTYTIAALYLRLVLGHGGERSFSRPLLPPEILVVTFTNAATEELRDRIRRRLTEAAQFFRGLRSDADDFLITLRGEYSEESWLTHGERLDQAAQWMDEAAIYTIHSWSQRMVRQHAFDSGSLFDLELSVNDGKLLEDAACDYWRSHFYNRSKEEIAELKSMVSISTPQDLLKRVIPLINLSKERSSYSSDKPIDTSDAESAFFENLPDPFDILKERRELIEVARSIWASDLNSAIELLKKAQADKTLKGNQYTLSSLNSWLEELKLWVEKRGPFPCEKVIQKFSATGLISGTAKSRTVPTHPAFDAFDTLLAQFAENHYLASPKNKNFQYLLYSYAAAEINKRVDSVKDRLALIGFDDMLTRLERALCKPGNGRFSEVIGNQYPVAMIDEFQDTDPLQYRIFSRIYLNRPDRGFFMIGDPKQAIYAFRGADIYTYLAARQDCEGNLYTLGKNFRSSREMVEAANQIFTFPGDDRAAHPDGTFLFRDKIPFEPVTSEGRDERFVVQEPGGAAISGVTLCHLNQQTPLKRSGRDGYIERMAQPFADKIVHMLNLAAENPPRAGFIAEDNRGGGGLQNSVTGYGFEQENFQESDTEPLHLNPQSPIIKPLRPSDIAVLVRNFHEADAIREALAMRNVRSVYLSDSDSVLESGEALSLLYILRACAEPTNDAFLRSALAAPLLALPISLLDELNQDETAWENQVDRFRNYLSIWQHQGVLPMVRALLFDFAIPSRLLMEPSGERKLTNILHLSEILQRAASNLDGEQALIRWFAKELKGQNRDKDSDEMVLRLESDDELIRVVTIHKSKGLEYPLVFLPFICTFREVTSRNSVVRYHDELGQLFIVVNPEKEDLAAADRERLAEDMRMLYVALTRSIYACWIGVGVIGRILAAGEKSELNLSALGYLLSGEKSILSADLVKKLEELKKGSPYIEIESLEVSNPLCHKPELYHYKNRERSLAPARHFSGKIPRGWWIASYSALLAGARMAVDMVAKVQPDGGSKGDTDTISTADRDAQLEKEGVSHLKSTFSEIFTLTAPDSPVHDQLQEYASEPSASPEINPSERTIHTFPRGPEAGTFLHELMEWAAKEGFCRISSDSQYLLCKIRALSARHGWDGWADFLTQWLQTLLQSPLKLSSDALSADPFTGGGRVTEITLATLSPGQCQAEMEFMFAADNVQISEVDKALHAAILPGMARPALQQNRLNGMVKGFIDLLFCYDGQYFIMDYKSNYLGRSWKSYTRSEMNNAVAEHRYDLQYILYTLALHRLLKSRLGNRYDYGRDVGGVIYLFMRGINMESINTDKVTFEGVNSEVMSQDSHGVYFDKPPHDLIDMLDSCFSGDGDSHAI